MEYSILCRPWDSLNKSALIINLSMHASVSVLAANDFALLKLDERCRSPLVGSLTDRLGMEPGKIEQSKHEFQIFCIYYMANPVLGKFLCSGWFFLGQDFAVRTISMEMVQTVYFCLGAKSANSTFATKPVKKKVWKLSFFTLKLPAEAKKIEIFPKSQR